MSNILVVSESNIAGGAEIVLNDYIRYSKYRNNFFLIGPKKSWLFKNIDSIDYNKIFTSRFLVKIPRYISYFIKPIFILLTTIQLLRIINKYNIEILLANNSQEILYLPIIKRLKKNIKTISIFHDIIHTRKINYLFFKYVANKSIDNYITVSTAVKKQLILNSVESYKISVIHNGVLCRDTKPKQLLNTDKLNFTFIGRLEDIKNPIEYINFLTNCKQFNLNYSAKLIYTPSNEAIYSKIKELIRLNSINIKLYESISREQIFSHLEQTDFLLVTSKKDSLPTVVLESFSVGTPVIGKAVGGIPDMIENESNGYIYFDENELLKIIIKLKSIDNTSYIKLSQNALNTVKEKFTIQTKVIKYDKLIFDK
jgi:glycosyltransferase involved in cell wall biosynthesis